MYWLFFFGILVVATCSGSSLVAPGRGLGGVPLSAPWWRSLVGSAPLVAKAAGKRVVGLGGGTGGATAARYLKMMDSSVDVTLIEPNTHYHTCYLSNEVLSGDRHISTIRFGYNGLRKHGVKVVHDTATGIDPTAKKIRTDAGRHCHQVARGKHRCTRASQLPHRSHD